MYEAELTQAELRRINKLQSKCDALKASRTKLITELRRLQRSTTSDKDFRSIEQVLTEAEKI